jgi:hypothetical protein
LGDAFLPLTEDVASSLFYNPAGLAKVRSTQIEPLNFSAYGNSQYAAGAGSNFYQVTSLSSYLSSLQSQSGEMAGVGGAVLPNFGFPGFGIGLLAQSELAAKANADGTVSYRSLYQLIPAVGFGFRLLSGGIRFGYSLQWVNQALGSRTQSSDGDLGYNQSLDQGSGFSHTLGLALTAPIKMLPSLNFVVRNAFDTQYNSSSIWSFTNNPSGTPGMDPMTVDASFSIQPRIGQGSVMNLVIQNRDITNRSGMAFVGHFALGMELCFRDAFFLRGGWGSGYPSAGLGLKRKGGEFNLTWYTQELGTQYLEQGDTRFMFQYQIRNF